MDTLPQWKRLPSVNHNRFDPRWGLIDDTPILTTVSSKPSTTIRWPSVHKQIVVPERNAEDHSGAKLINSYILAAGAASGLILILIVFIYVVAKKKRQKKADEEQNAASILVYPSNNGDSQPQFLTKEIHFSLPPLRSNSLGDLECQQNNPYDSDIDTDALLVPGQSHSHRSNSFSCYGLGVIEPALYKSSLDLDELSWPDGHIGRIWFSLRYEPSTEKLLVSLLKAKNLPSRTLGTVNSCDPFVRLHLIPDERRYLQSKQKKKTCNPYFDETLVFQVSQKDMADHILKLSVIDGGRAKRHAEIGHVAYPLKELEIGDGSEQQLFKMDLEKEPQEIRSDHGELLVSLLYNENLSRLTATVIEARRLKNLPQRFDWYVSLTVFKYKHLETRLEIHTNRNVVLNSTNKDNGTSTKNMSIPTPLPRTDSIKPIQSNGISPKISQLHQVYTQPQKISKQQQDELNKKLKQSKLEINENSLEEKSNVPKRLIIDTTMSSHGNINNNGNISNDGGIKSNGNGLNGATNIVNSKFENLNSKCNGKEMLNCKADSDEHGKTTKHLNHNIRELNLENFNYKKSAKINSKDNGVDKSSKGLTESVIEIEGHEIMSKKNVKEYVSIARKAFKSGRTRSLEFREKQLNGLLKFLENHRIEIEEALYKDLRKHRQETNISEIELVANDLRYTLMKLKKWMGPEKPPKRVINILDGVYVYNDPYGVVLMVGAWNYPILLTLGPLVGALAGGNTVILKPSELAPATNKLLIDVLTHYLDEECFQVYLGGIHDTTELLKERFDYIFFTGSSKVGQIVYQAAAKNLTPCTLELGGKCPLYVDESADMQKTAKRILWGKMLNSGQTCVAPDYILCTKEIQEKFLLEAQKVLKKFWGEEPSRSESLSRIVSERHYKRLIDFMKTEKIALGGQVNQQELVIGPTILTDVNPHSSVMEEEIFGPILPIVNIKDVQEAIDFINSREKPLALYVFSKQKNIQNLFLNKTSSGGVTINDTVAHIGTESLPFGGVGMSGLGCYHGKYGFDTFTHKKGVLVKDFGNITEMTLSVRYPPYSEKKTNFINTILKKRRGIRFGFLDRVLIFCLGVGITFLLQYYFHLI